MDSDDKPLLRRECDHCQIKTEVDNMKGWLNKIDNRMWAALVFAVTNLIGIITLLVMNVFQKVPAIAAVKP